MENKTAVEYGVKINSKKSLKAAKKLIKKLNQSCKLIERLNAKDIVINVKKK